MEWIAQLDFEKIANAIVILLTGFLGAFAFRKGKASPGPPQSTTSHLEVAGALVDSSSIKQAAIEVSALAGHLADQNELAEKFILAVDRHRHAVDDLTEQVRELRQAMPRR